MKQAAVAFVWAILSFTASGQILYSSGEYTQDFNSLDSGIIYRNYTNLPTGWALSRGSYVWTTVTNGYSNNYGTYCFSLSAADPDKALGLVIGSTGAAYLGVSFRNASAVTLNAFTVTYYAEQWAKGGTSAVDQTIPFEFSLDATNLTSGTYTHFPALDMHSINDGDGSFSRLDGNATPNRQRLTGTVSRISWGPGQDLWIRWRGVSYNFFTAHALAVDDFAFSAAPTATISPGGPGRLLIRWSTNYSGFNLEASPGSLLWEQVTNVPTLLGSEFSVELEASDPFRFFRLKAP